MLNNTRLSVKLAASFLIMAVILLILGLLGIRGELSMRNHLLSMSQESLPAVMQLNRLNYERVQIRSQTYEIKGLIQWTPRTRELLEQIQRQRIASWTVMDAALKQLQQLPQSVDEQAVFSVLQSDYTTWRQHYTELERLTRAMIDATSQESYFDALAQFSQRVDEIFLLSDRVAVLIESLVALKNRSSTDTLLAAQSESHLMILLYGTGIVLGMIMAVVLGWLTTHDTLRQIGGEPARVVAIVNQLAEGDLATTIHVRAGDETSLLAAMARMVEQLRRVLRDVATASSQVAAAAVELSANSEQTRQQVHLEQAETDQVATAMNQMTATVEEVARHAAAAARAAQDTDRETEAGGHVVAQTISAINLLAQEVESAGEVIARLSDDSSEIGAVLDVIRGVAEQTNLLALNAAIEAARAGEQGRGFAVVAAEVRTLASRTQSSIQDIQEKIERVQKGSAGAVAVMTKGQDMARESVVQAQRAGESLQAISAAIASINDMNRQIASAAEEQTAVAEEINRNIHTISTTVDQTAAGSAHIASASEELARLASLLQARVAQFRL
ncbi:methyl-accepting chemotaxis protein [Allochromatium warmingii]|uniref:Methyl-accepting chemotaxis protein n=1 Tax=Allochromatium warmingii TaxID=61595 RepID=A0A1H3CJ79_ALLWA|nr:methyl-accepting chemotaxis protein [Allochromatium warmingii]SDX53654.1 methyl-accepting chemotaxis protein [Allochromatium warmingii]